MKKIMMCFGLSLTMLLSACSSSATAKVNANTIEVSASTTDEVEELANKDVADTIQSLNDSRDALAAKITDYNSYKENENEIKTYYENAIKESNLLGVRLREYAYKYAEIIMNNEDTFNDKYKDLGGIYDYIYNDAGKDMFDIYDKTIQQMYDTYYDGVLDDAYDNDQVAYDEWYDAKSDAYEDWSDTKSDIYEIYSDTLSDIYEFESDLRSEVYDKDKERATKKMNKFKKDILRLKEDANEE